MPSLTDTTSGPYTLQTGTTAASIAPFADITINDPYSISTSGTATGDGTITITLSGALDATMSAVIDGSPDGTWNAATKTFTIGFGDGPQVPEFESPSYILDQILISVDSLPAGVTQTLSAAVSFTPALASAGGFTPGQTITDPTPIVIDVSGPAVQSPAAPASAPVLTTVSSVPPATPVVSTPAITPVTVATSPALLISGDPMSDSAQVSRLYYATLDRGPDPDGLAGWTADMQAGESITTIAAGFVNSPEFIADYQFASDPANFVTLLYANVLDRAPDAVGLANWTNSLNAGVLTRTQVVVGFSNSQEFINRVG